MLWVLEFSGATCEGGKISTVDMRPKRRRLRVYQAEAAGLRMAKWRLGAVTLADDSGHLTACTHMSFYCPAADGLYLKASGDLVCWNSPGENVPLSSVRMESLDEVDVVSDVLNGTRMRQMRRDLYEHRNPFPFCVSCSWGCHQDDSQWSRVNTEDFSIRGLRVLQIEPSFLCNLDCPACFPFAKRREGGKNKILHPAVLRKVIDDLARHAIPVDLVHLSGLGEPLMSPHFTEIVRYIKRRLGSPVHCHTNANFEFEADLLDCGLGSLTLAMDGSREETYGEYRKRGQFSRALLFARRLCAAKRRTGLDTLNVAWKTVMFQWNSSDQDVVDTLRLADQVGPDEIVLANSTTVGGISHGHDRTRWLEIMDLVENELASEVKTPIRFEDPDCFGGQSYRTFGYLESIKRRDEGLVLSGWLLLDDGPPDSISVVDRDLIIPATHHPRPDVAERHPLIHRAGESGFRIQMPTAYLDHRPVRIRFMRRGEERAHVELRTSSGCAESSPEPVELKHRKQIEWTTR